MRTALATIALNAGLAALAVLTLFPLFWMAAASLMTAGEAGTWPPPLVPRSPTLEHYRQLLTDLAIGRQAFNSLAIALSATLISLLFNSMAGYAFAKLRFAGRDRVFGLLLLGMIVPGQVGMLPLFLMLKGMGLINSLFGIIVPCMASISGIFLMRQYALSIPDSLIDAARIDGAGEFRIFVTLILPLARPVLATLALFTFMAVWNDFMWPLVVLTDDRLYTLPVALANLAGEHVQDTEMMMAGALLTVLPVVILFVALQRHYVAGLATGSVKT